MAMLACRKGLAGVGVGITNATVLDSNCCFESSCSERHVHSWHWHWHLAAFQKHFTLNRIVVLYLACNNLLLVVARGIRCPSFNCKLNRPFFFSFDDRHQQRSRVPYFSLYHSPVFFVSKKCEFKSRISLSATSHTTSSTTTTTIMSS